MLSGAAGFDPDDLFYLVGPFVWARHPGYLLASGAMVPAAIAIRIWRRRAARQAPQVAARQTWSPDTEY